MPGRAAMLKRIRSWLAARRGCAIVAAAVTAVAASACGTVMSGAAAACHPPSSAAAGHAPPVTVLTQGADSGSSDIFIAPQGCGYASGPEVLTRTGKVVW